MFEKFDIVVVGGGPAGLMAAGRAAELGASVLLLEKNNRPGLKLLMTGGGRCNFSNNLEAKIFAKKLGAKGSWFIPALNFFGPEEVISFFEARGLKTKIEDNNRVFPCSDKASDVLDLLIAYANKGGVKIMNNSSLAKVVKKDDYISKLILANGEEIFADKFIFACGGKSYPGSGSSGEVYSFLKGLGHKIIKTKPALSQLIVKDKLSDLEGLSFSDVSLFAANNSFKSPKIIGSIVFSKKGISGPAALDLSRHLNRENDSLNLYLDFFPNKKISELEFEIEKLFSDNKNFSVKNCLATLISKRMSFYLLDKIKIEMEKKSSLLSKKEVLDIAKTLKSLSFDFFTVAGFNEAMITSGGLDLLEVDNKKMLSKLISNLYVAGELLDLDGPSGGYNLQIAWTSAYLAASSAVLD